MMQSGRGGKHREWVLRRKHETPLRDFYLLSTPSAAALVQALLVGSSTNTMASKQISLVQQPPEPQPFPSPPFRGIPPRPEICCAIGSFGGLHGVLYYALPPYLGTWNSPSPDPTYSRCLLPEHPFLLPCLAESLQLFITLLKCYEISRF